MESQESDICAPDEMAMILGSPGLGDLMQVDWSQVYTSDAPIVNPTGELPARNEWPGSHFFDAKVDVSGAHKKNYVVSTKLNKVFVDLGNVVPFQIKWDGTANLYLRALLAYKQADFMKLPVLRCAMHSLKEDATNTRYDHSDHVLATENDNAQYLVDPVSNRRSVRVPLLLQQGCDHALVNYKFMCKTSCTGGINRCLTDVIFTLEDESENVLGRQIIGVKICSCPKRDKEKEEANSGEPSGKRKKVKKEKTVEEPALKRVKQEFEPLETNHQSTFMVAAASPQIAEAAKEHLRRWSEIKSVEWGLSSPLINLVDDIAVVSQPYN